jgi:hypothetical protein
MTTPPTPAEAARLLAALTNAELLLLRRRRGLISKEEYAQADAEAWRRVRDCRREIEAAGRRPALPEAELIAEFRVLSHYGLQAADDEEALCTQRAVVNELHRQYPGWDRDMRRIIGPALSDDEVARLDARVARKAARG